MNRPFALYWLSFFLLFVAFGGLYGGIAMLLDPSGAVPDMAGILPLLPVSSFALPGLFLLVGMGLIPIALVYALPARPEWAGLARWSGLAVTMMSISSARRRGWVKRAWKLRCSQRARASSPARSRTIHAGAP